MYLLQKEIQLSTCLLLFILYCSPSSPDSSDLLTDGNGSGVGTGKTTGIINGMLYKPDGVTPACGATVEVRRKNETAFIASGGNTRTHNPHYQTVTDKKGFFAFDTIDSGLYVIEGSDDQGNMVLLDSILIHAPIETLSLSSATLAPAGAIRGNISLANGGNPLQVFILAFGVDRFSQVKADGSFLFSGLAAGTYTLKILSLDAGYGSKDTAGIIVISSDTINLGTVRLPLRKIGAPELQLVYDPYLIQATLTWSCPPQSVVKGYNIYRLPRTVESDSTISMNVPLNNQLLIDSMFIDSFKNLSSDSESNEMGYDLEPGLHFTYHVSMVDSTDNEGPLSNEVEVTLSSVLEPYDSIQLEAFPGGVDNGSLTLNNNGEFILLLNQPVGITGGSTHVYRYSRNGHILSTWQFPESLVGDDWISTVKSNDTTGLCYFSAETNDGMLLYRTRSTGVFLDTFSINDKTGYPVISNNILFYLKCDPFNDHSIIRRDLQANTTIHWREYPGSSIENLYPLPDGRIGVALSTIDDSAVKKNFIILDANGSELFSIPLQNDCFMAASDSLFVFTGNWYRLSAQGTMCRCRCMPYIGNPMLGSNDTVFAFVLESGKILISRYPNEYSLRIAAGSNQPREGI